MNLDITWLHDDYDCEDCGGSYAEGARVTLDGEPFLELIPVAHCFGGADYPTKDVYNEILKKLGYSVVETDW